MCTIHYKICQKLLFLFSVEYKVVCIDILHHYSIHHCPSQKFDSDFFKILKYEFWEFENRGLRDQVIKGIEREVPAAGSWRSLAATVGARVHERDGRKR
jgi:hypothetical protein